MGEGEFHLTWIRHWIRVGSKGWKVSYKAPSLFFLEFLNSAITWQNTWIWRQFLLTRIFIGRYSLFRRWKKRILVFTANRLCNMHYKVFVQQNNHIFQDSEIVAFHGFYEAWKIVVNEFHPKTLHSLQLLFFRNQIRAKIHFEVYL